METRFSIGPDHSLSESAVRQAYMQGFEGIPWTSQNQLRDGELVIQREANGESGLLSIPWQVDGQPPLTLTTASLWPRETPYVLIVELARGTLHRVRQYIANNRLDSIPIPARVTDLVSAATRLLGESVTASGDLEKMEAAAQISLRKSLEAIEDLGYWDADGLLKMRAGQQGSSPLLVGFRCPENRDITDLNKDDFPSANFCHIPVSWKACQTDLGTLNLHTVKTQLQFSQERQSRTMAGPLITLDEQHLPSWLDDVRDDFQQLQALARLYIEQVVRQLKGQVHIWHATAGLNRSPDHGLNEEQCMRLTVDAVETIRRHDPHTPVIVSLAQPWGEYLSDHAQDLSPIHFAEALSRANLGLSGIGLEIDWQFHSAATQPRDLLAVALQLDRWSLLQLPLAILFQASTGAEGSEQQECEWHSAHHVGQLLNVMLARPSVQALAWQQLYDEGESGTRGLLSNDGSQKRILESLESLAGQLTEHAGGDST